MKKSALLILLIFVVLCSACSKAEENSFEKILPQGVYFQEIFKTNIGYMNQDEGKDVVIMFSQLETDVIMEITFRNSDIKKISIQQVLVENDLINDEQNITYSDNILDELSESSTIKGLIVFVTAHGSSTKDIAVTFDFDSENSDFFSIKDFIEWNENREIRTLDDWKNQPVSYDNIHQGLYKPVIDSGTLAVNELFDKGNDYQKEYPFICNYGQKEYGRVSYSLLDINDDNLSELLIFGGMDYIIDVYAIKDGEPVRAFELAEPRGFFTRHRLYLDKDNKTFKLESSGGAMYNDAAFYQVNKDGVGEQIERYSQEGDEYWRYDSKGNKTAVNYDAMSKAYANTSANEHTKSGIKWKELD